MKGTNNFLSPGEQSTVTVQFWTVPGHKIAKSTKRRENDANGVDSRYVAFRENPKLTVSLAEMQTYGHEDVLGTYGRGQDKTSNETGVVSHCRNQRWGRWIGAYPYQKGEVAKLIIIIQRGLSPLDLQPYIATKHG